MQLGRSEQARRVVPRPRSAPQGSSLAPPPRPRQGAFIPAMMLGLARPLWASVSPRGGDAVAGWGPSGSLRGCRPRPGPGRRGQEMRKGLGSPSCPPSGAAKRQGPEPHSPTWLPPSPSQQPRDRQGKEATGRRHPAELGPGQQRFPVASSRARSCITSSGSHSGKELQSPGGLRGEPSFPRPLLAASGAGRGQAPRLRVSACRASDRWEGSWLPSAFRGDQAGLAARRCPWPAGYRAGGGFISRAGTECWDRGGCQVQAGGGSPALAPSGPQFPLRPASLPHLVLVSAPRPPPTLVATGSTGHK